MIYSISFSDCEQHMIEEYAELYDMTASEVIKKATLEMIEDELDVRAYEGAMKKFKEDPTTHSHEEVGKELGFL
ncbi:type II toxin-antitoxin system RelB family antitoxin [Candidatus Methanomassiliicoccus intestinalis]|uniref:type II toxin-antitoxin system RelB family antitoxin n=1 Tax=Candidatus Methanomassiliicoccus intestinalis TaxID=1406512 RepID=UPI0037DDC1CD